MQTMFFNYKSERKRLTQNENKSKPESWELRNSGDATRGGDSAPIAFVLEVSAYLSPLSSDHPNQLASDWSDHPWRTFSNLTAFTKKPKSGNQSIPFQTRKFKVFPWFDQWRVALKMFSVWNSNKIKRDFWCLGGKKLGETELNMKWERKEGSKYFDSLGCEVGKLNQRLR